MRTALKKMCLSFSKYKQNLRMIKKIKINKFMNESVP